MLKGDKKMEKVKFTYSFNDGESQIKEVVLAKEMEEGLKDFDICEMFLDFMKAAGYCEENVFKYFR